MITLADGYALLEEWRLGIVTILGPYGKCDIRWIAAVLLDYVYAVNLIT